jgi:hypothetical protein
VLNTILHWHKIVFTTQVSQNRFTYLYVGYINLYLLDLIPHLQEQPSQFPVMWCLHFFTYGNNGIHESCYAGTLTELSYIYADAWPTEVKSIVPMTNRLMPPASCPCINKLLGSGGIVPCILDLALQGGQWSASCPGRFTPSIHWKRGWVGPRASLDTVGKGKIPSPCWESTPKPNLPAHSQSSY